MGDPYTGGSLLTILRFTLVGKASGSWILLFPKSSCFSFEVNVCFI